MSAPPSLSRRVQNLLGSMSLAEKAGQIFIFTFLSQKQAENDLALHPGGYVRIYSDALTTARESRHLQSLAKTPLILSADFERGIGPTIPGAVDLAGNMCIGAANEDQLAYDTGLAIAEEARAIGINMNYVPVLDVNINEANPIINIRAFGSDPELVGRLGAAMIRGSRAGGVITCGKHFPGHGDTHIDTHTSLAAIEASRARLESVELIPFRHAIAAGVDAIMSAHLHIPACEPEPIPATMSPRIMRDLLRDELGFRGLTVTDALDMGGISRGFTREDAIIRALNAGCDQLIMPHDNRHAVQTVIDAVRGGQISEQRLDEAVANILTVKENRGLFDDQPLDLANIADRLNTPAHLETARRTALAGITLVRDTPRILPLASPGGLAVVSFSSYDDARSYYMSPKTFSAHCASGAADVPHIDCGTVTRAESQDEAIRIALEAGTIVLAAYTKLVINAGTMDLPQRFVEFVSRILAVGKPVVLLSFGSPYIIKQFPQIGTFVCAYGSSEATQKAAADLILGHAPFRGRLPVELTLSA